jgi:hypothetical protein
LLNQIQMGTKLKPAKDLMNDRSGPQVAKESSSKPS